jgi:hypothetical protein
VKRLQPNDWSRIKDLGEVALDQFRAQLDRLSPNLPKTTTQPSLAKIQLRWRRSALTFCDWTALSSLTVNNTAARHSSHLAVDAARPL